MCAGSRSAGAIFAGIFLSSAPAGAFLFRIECFHKKLILRVQNAHHPDKDLKGHLPQAVIRAVGGEIIPHIQVTVDVQAELYVTEPMVEKIAGLQQAAAFPVLCFCLRSPVQNLQKAGMTAKTALILGWDDCLYGEMSKSA